MKRSQINAALKELEAMCEKYCCYLPPFCHFTPLFLYFVRMARASFSRGTVKVCPVLARWPT